MILFEPAIGLRKNLHTVSGIERVFCLESALRIPANCGAEAEVMANQF
jgi:hypothetical protein